MTPNGARLYMSKQYLHKAIGKITLGSYVASFCQQLLPITAISYLHKVAGESIVFDPLDIIHRAPLAAAENALPFFVKGYKEARTLYQRKQKFKRHLNSSADFLHTQPYTTLQSNKHSILHRMTRLKQPTAVRGNRYVSQNRMQ